MVGKVILGTLLLTVFDASCQLGVKKFIEYGERMEYRRMKLKVCLVIILHFVLDFLAIVLLGNAIGGHSHSHGLHIGIAVAFTVVCSIVFFHKHKPKDK